MPDSVRFDDYTISVVHGAMDDRLADEIMTFWKVNGALADPGEARRRVAEVVCLARNPAGAIVGLNTAYLSTLRQPPQAYYLYRAFIRSADRRLGLAKCMHYLCYAHLQTCSIIRSILGVALVVENAKFTTTSGKAYLEQCGGRYAGTDRIGRHIWTFDFDDQALNQKVSADLARAARESVPVN